MSIVARQYDVNSNQVFAWRKLYGDASTARPGPQLVPIVVTGQIAREIFGNFIRDLIEIELPGGCLIRFGNVKAATLRLVLDALERR